MASEVPTQFIVRLLADKSVEGGQYVIEELPDLDIICQRVDISLCPSFYGGSMVCFRAGGIALTVYINTVEVVLRSEDGKNTSYDMDTEAHRYHFETLGPVLVEGRAYLKVRITQRPLIRGNTYRVGDTFQLNLAINYTTGTTLNVTTTEGLEIIDRHFHLNSDAEGAGGVETVIFRTKMPGAQSIYIRRDRPGSPGGPQEVKVTVVN
jgi:predicted secreted protein